MMKRTVFKITVLSLVLLVAVPFSANATDGQIKIGQTASTTFPIVIDQPGSYVLTSNLIVSTELTNGINITADNVTLDLNGHSITGHEPRVVSRGISITGKDISITNGTIKIFDVGIEGGNLKIKDINIVGTWRALDVGASIITNCSFHSNADDGMFIDSSTMINCSVHANIGGIIATNSNIINSKICYNGDYGLVATNCTVSNCLVTNTGLDVGIEASNSTITNCTVIDNNSGISASKSIITNCTVTDNTSSGIKASGDSRIEGNNLRGNGSYGLLLEGSHNYATRNTASGNASGNFQDNGTSNHMPTTGDNANMGW